jgi:nucleoside-diphosphate-sugar epimerase
MKQKKRVLVTGGAGYIGSQTVRKLLQKGYKVRILDNFIFGDASVKELYSNPDFEVHKGDIRHIEDLVASLKECFGVIHLAGIVGDSACEIDPDATHAINYEATKLIVEVAQYRKVSRFVFASTCSVYGAAEEYQLNEGSVLNPVSLYAESNLRSEAIILRGFERTETVPVIVRFATVYGKSYRMRFDLVVNILSAKAVKDGRIKIYGGNQWRPNVHVEDAADALIRCFEEKDVRVAHEIFNIGSNEQNYRIIELGELVCKILPGTEMDVLAESPDARSYYVSFDKAVHVLGNKVNHTVEDGVLEIKELFDSDLIPDYLNDRYYNVKYPYK